MCFHLLILYSFIYSFLVVPGEQAEFYTLEGQVFSGTLVDSEGENQWVIETKDGLKPLNLSDLYSIFFSGFFSGPPEEARADYEAGLEFTDGSYLSGLVDRGDEEFLFFTHPFLGRLKVSIDHVARLLLASPSLPADFVRHPRSSEEDVVYRRQEGIRGKDYINGTLIRFTPEGLSFDCALGPLEFSFAELEALTLAQFEKPVLPPGRPVRIVFRNGAGVLHGALRAVRAKHLEVAALFKERVTISYDAVDSILLENPRVVHLSDFPPVSVAQIPYIGGPEFFLYPYQKDRSVTGQRLSCRKKTFAKGLGIHSKTRLRYALEGRFLAFESFLGLSDEVLELPAKGSVRLEVEVDGKEVYVSPVIRGGAPPLRIPRIDLKGASEMSLTIDFADRFDSGDRALLGIPILIKVKDS